MFVSFHFIYLVACIANLWLMDDNMMSVWANWYVDIIQNWNRNKCIFRRNILTFVLCVVPPGCCPPWCRTCWSRWCSRWSWTAPTPWTSPRTGSHLTSTPGGDIEHPVTILPSYRCWEPDDVEGHPDTEDRVIQPGSDQRVVDSDGGAIDQEPQQDAEHRAVSQKCLGPETLCWASSRK